MGITGKGAREVKKEGGGRPLRCATVRGRRGRYGWRLWETLTQGRRAPERRSIGGVAEERPEKRENAGQVMNRRRREVALCSTSDVTVSGEPKAQGKCTVRSVILQASCALHRVRVCAPARISHRSCTKAWLHRTARPLTQLASPLHPFSIQVFP